MDEKIHGPRQGQRIHRPENTIALRNFFMPERLSLESTTVTTDSTPARKNSPIGQIRINLVLFQEWVRCGWTNHAATPE